MVKLVAGIDGVDLNVKMTGAFIHQVFPKPEAMECLDKVGLFARIGERPLEVALLTPVEDHDAMESVKVLLRQGAEVIFCEVVEAEAEETSFLGWAGAAFLMRATTSAVNTKTRFKEHQVMYTLLHALARARWEGLGPHHISEARTRMALHFLCGEDSEFHRDPAASNLAHTRNSFHYTPLQVAAAVGNEAMFRDMLDGMKEFVWAWGNKRAYAFPLEDFDTSTSAADSLSALELLTMMKRKNLLCMGIVSSIIDQKWDSFGRMLLWTFMLFESTVLIAAGIVNIDDTKGPNAFRNAARFYVVLGSAAYLIGLTTLVIVRGLLNDAWFMMLMRGHLGSTGIRAQLIARQVITFTVMSIMCIMSPQSHIWSQAEVFWWAMSSSVWWLIMLVHVICYFDFFESTAPLANAIPIIFEKDMLPFFGVFGVLSLFVCTALTIAAGQWRYVGTVGEPIVDTTAGTWSRTFLTLEEAIHGPDVRWREFVSPDRNMLTGFIFVGFLWLTLIALSMVVGMFSVRYDELRKVDAEVSRHNYSRALFLISMEKLLPLPKSKCAIGTTFGRTTYGSSDSSNKFVCEHHGLPCRQNSLARIRRKGPHKHRTWHANESQTGTLQEGRAAARYSAIEDVEAGEPLGGYENENRWLIWKSDAQSLDAWAKPVSLQRENEL